MLWACIALPELPLEVVFDDVAAAPRALYAGPAQRPLIVALDASAREAGVRHGHTLAEARALAPALEVQQRRPRAEAERLSTLAAWAYGYSSQVVEVAPAAVLLEVGASLKLFGGWARLQALLHEGLQALGHQHVLAAAPTPAGAERLALSGRGMAVLSRTQLRNALADLPLPACGLPERQVKALQAVGWRQLGALYRVPRAELARRFERSLPGFLDRLFGEQPDPRPLYRPPDRFDRLREFDAALESIEALGFPLQRLCGDLAAYLHSRDGGVQHFLLLCGHEDAPATPISVGLRAPQRDAGALFDAARGQLERSALPGPVCALGLHAEHLPPFVPERRDLFDPAPRGALDWPTLSERLQARLGSEAIRQLQVYPDHRPERAWRIAESPARSSSTGAEGPARPLWLLPRPVPLRQAVVRQLGDVERIESGWWDGDDARRDYIVAELDSGQCAWLYREAGSQGPWMLHGWFS